MKIFDENSLPRCTHTIYRCPPHPQTMLSLIKVCDSLTLNPLLKIDVGVEGQIYSNFQNLQKILLKSGDIGSVLFYV